MGTGKHLSQRGVRLHWAPSSELRVESVLLVFCQALLMLHTARVTVAANRSRISLNLVLRSLSTGIAPLWQPLPTVTTDLTVESFREKAFGPSQPLHFEIKDPSTTFPATSKWFIDRGEGKSLSFNAFVGLDDAYLSPYASTIVPLELTTTSNNDTSSFQRAEAPLGIFLEYCKFALAQPPNNENKNNNKKPDGPSAPRFYLAQASLSLLPEPLRHDLPTPEIVSKAGTGDIYDANLWMGLAPTYTPLHRDPNPNVFIQFAGKKIVRMMPPERGDAIFEQVQNMLCRDDDRGVSSKAFRGNEMMAGEERRLLEEAVWRSSESTAHTTDGDWGRDGGYEVVVDAGTGVFIPQGWWHSIKGIGNGITASVNWWFR